MILDIDIIQLVKKSLIVMTLTSVLCVICGHSCLTKALLAKHQKRIHDERTFNCDLCHQEFIGLVRFNNMGEDIF